MKRFVVAVLAFLACTFAHADEGWTLKEKATAAAVADGVTTAAFLVTKTAVEANPLMPTALPGVLAITAAKALFLFSQNEKTVAGKTLLRFGFAEFAGLAVNNTLLIAHVNPIVAPIVGVAVAAGIWIYEANKDEAEANEPQAEKGAVATPQLPVLDGQTQPEVAQ